MKVLLTTTIVLGLSFGACFTPPKKAQSPYPEIISLQEVIDINQAFLLDDAYTNISGDYFIEGDVHFDFGDDSFTGGLTASIPFAIGTDGFEVTVRSQDMSFVGDLEEFLPEFKARITAS
ncbi:MAG: hypothetical protein QGF46_04880, partial [Planctomycetota bacterium]|nr:hypothetical protein [Planctomycetota bacterium]